LWRRLGRPSFGVDQDALLDAPLEQHDAQLFERRTRPTLSAQAIEQLRFGGWRREQPENLVNFRRHGLPLRAAAAVIELEQPLIFRTAVERLDAEGGVHLPSCRTRGAHRGSLRDEPS
jgi:hypothetical protein